MSPADELVFIGYLAAPFLIVLGLVVLGAIEIADARRRRGGAGGASGRG